MRNISVAFYIKVKCKGHNFFQIYTFLDKLTCLKPREISIMPIPL